MGEQAKIETVERWRKEKKVLASQMQSNDTSLTNLNELRLRMRRQEFLDLSEGILACNQVLLHAAGGPAGLNGLPLISVPQTLCGLETGLDGYVLPSMPSPWCQPIIDPGPEEGLDVVSGHDLVSVDPLAVIAVAMWALLEIPGGKVNLGNDRELAVCAIVELELPLPLICSIAKEQGLFNVAIFLSHSSFSTIDVWKRSLLWSGWAWNTTPMECGVGAKSIHRNQAQRSTVVQDILGP